MTTKTSKKTSKTGNKNNHPSKDSTLNMVQYEIIAMIVLALTIFVMISIYLKSGGIVGEFVRQFFFGIFGISAWVMPIAIFVATFLKLFNKGNERLNIKILLSFLVIAFISVTAHITYVELPQINIKLFEDRAIFASLFNYYSVSAGYEVGGGFIGALIGDILLLFVGRIGTFVVLAVIFISLLIAITEQSFLMIVKKLFDIIILKLKKLIIFIGEKSEERKLAKEKLAEENNYDIVKHIERNEEQEQRQKKNMDTHISFIKEDLKTQTTIDEKPKKIEKTEKISKVEMEKGKAAIKQEILKEVEVVEAVYKSPPMELLKHNSKAGNKTNGLIHNNNAKKLEDTLASFGVGAKVIDVTEGPSVTRYELQPDQGVKVSKIVNLADDIALNLAANGIRIEAPIPGKAAVGIEVPNEDVSTVFLREVLDTPDFEHFPSKVAFGLGKDISGKVIVTDIARMPHLLIAGATGSGKSVCVNTLITSILYKSSPEDVKLLMIDPKVVELSIYNGIPHLLIPVVTDPKKAASALNWAVQEMLDRYKLFAAANARDIKGYNKAVADNADGLKKLPKIVIIVDELADLMVVAAGEVEEAICRLAQMARAAGLHLIIATQRPSVDVITGLIKANIPSRIAFNVSSGVDSRTIIDMNGAEKLLGKGDMLFYPVGLHKPIRVQGAFVSEKEIENIVTYLKGKKKEEYDEKIMKQLDKSVSEKNTYSNEFDPIFEDALELCVDKQKASASMIQRRFRVGFNRAARILDQLYDAGYVSEDEGSKPRKMLLTKTEFEELKKRANNEGQNEGQYESIESERMEFNDIDSKSMKSKGIESKSNEQEQSSVD